MHTPTRQTNSLIPHRLQFSWVDLANLSQRATRRLRSACFYVLLLLHSFSFIVAPFLRTLSLLNNCILVLPLQGQGVCVMRCRIAVCYFYLGEWVHCPLLCFLCFVCLRASNVSKNKDSSSSSTHYNNNNTSRVRGHACVGGMEERNKGGAILFCCGAVVALRGVGGITRGGLIPSLATSRQAPCERLGGRMPRWRRPFFPKIQRNTGTSSHRNQHLLTKLQQDPAGARRQAETGFLAGSSV